MLLILTRRLSGVSPDLLRRLSILEPSIISKLGIFIPYHKALFDYRLLLSISNLGFNLQELTEKQDISI
jgi:hypothetical protein